MTNAEIGHFSWQGLLDDYRTYCGVVYFSLTNADCELDVSNQSSASASKVASHHV